MNFTPDVFSGARSLLPHSIDLEKVSNELLDLNKLKCQSVYS